MDVACSTLCFSREPLAQALRHIAEMEFAKVDLAVGENGAHLTGAEVLNDLPGVLQRIRQGPTIGFSAITIRLPDGPDFVGQVNGIAHLAQQLACPIVAVDAAPAGTPIANEAARLSKIQRSIAVHGTLLTVTTKIGTITELPGPAVELCEKVPGLGLTLDPSHYVCGPLQNESYDEVLPYVKHAHLRDSGRGREQMQVHVGRGEIEYGKIVTALQKFGYRGSLAVAIEDRAPVEMDVEAEVRKLRLLLESLL